MFFVFFSSPNGVFLYLQEKKQESAFLQVNWNEKDFETEPIIDYFATFGKILASRRYRNHKKKRLSNFMWIEYEDWKAFEDVMKSGKKIESEEIRGEEVEGAELEIVQHMIGDVEVFCSKRVMVSLF